MLASIGLTPSYLRDDGCGMAALEQTLLFKRELFAGDIVEVHREIVDMGEKIACLRHSMANAETGEIVATCAITGVNMDRHLRKSRPFPHRRAPTGEPHGAGRLRLTTADVRLRRSCGSLDF